MVFSINDSKRHELCHWVHFFFNYLPLSEIRRKYRECRGNSGDNKLPHRLANTVFDKTFN